MHCAAAAAAEEDEHCIEVASAYLALLHVVSSSCKCECTGHRHTNGRGRGIVLGATLIILIGHNPVEMV